MSVPDAQPPRKPDSSLANTTAIKAIRHDQGCSRWLLALVFLLLVFLIFGTMSWVQGRLDGIDRRLDAIGAPDKP